MTKPTKRSLTDGDRYEIQTLWHEYQNLRRLAARYEDTGSDGPWIAAAARNSMEQIVARLDQLFEETAP